MISMNLDAARRKAASLILCYRCRKAGHKSTDCDLCFDIHTCTVDKLQGFPEDKLAALNVVAEEDDVTVEEDKPKEKDFLIHNE
jgi:Zinc knuckle